MELLNDETKLFAFVNKLSTRYFHKPFIDEVYFNDRLRTTGGRYIPNYRVIELNPKYVVELGEDALIGIIKHELCHYHLHIEGKGYKHGDIEFKELLKKTNSPRHCKSLPSLENKYNYIYQCRKCATRYKRIRKVNIDKYTCGKCRGKLELIKSI